MDFQEVKIPVPWGHVAAKTWGDEKDPLVLAIHGWTDNANTFDTLIPLLPHSYYYVCIDLPSHGKSTELQASLHVHEIDYVLVIKLIYDYFKRQQIILLGHSMGGMLSISFAQFFPQYVAKLIIFDIYFYYPISPNTSYKLIEHGIKMNIAFSKKITTKAPPNYNKEEAVQRMMSGRMTPISQKAAEILTERGLRQLENGKYRFVVPQNIKHIIRYGRPMHSMVQISRKFPVKCPHLLILSSNSSFMKIVFKDVHKEYEKNNDFEFHIVEGNHEVHLEHPERVAPLVTDFLFKYNNTDFLLKYNSKL